MRRTEKLYHYVGPEEVRSRSAAVPCGQVIVSPDDLQSWLACCRPSGAGGSVVATFVIDPEGALRLADRHSEHIACAGGGPVLSAGEMFFLARGDALVVEDVSKLSTGDCPEPESWAAVGEALDRIGVLHPGRFTTEVAFRRCRRCGERNVVKDGSFECQSAAPNYPMDATSTPEDRLLRPRTTASTATSRPGWGSSRPRRVSPSSSPSSTGR